MVPRVVIDMPATVDTGSFARYVPFGDKREVIVRRGAELGRSHGLPKGTRRVVVSALEFDRVTYQTVVKVRIRQRERFEPLLGDT